MPNLGFELVFLNPFSLPEFKKGIFFLDFAVSLSFITVVSCSVHSWLLLAGRK